MIFQSVEQVRVIPKPVMEPALEREVGVEDIMSNNQYFVIPRGVSREDFLDSPKAVQASMLADVDAAKVAWESGQAVISLADMRAYQRVMSGRPAADDPILQKEEKVETAPAPAAEAKPRKRGRRGGKKHGKPAERPATDNVVDLVSAAPSLDESAEATGTDGK